MAKNFVPFKMQSYENFHKIIILSLIIFDWRPNKKKKSNQLKAAFYEEYRIIITLYVNLV